LQFTGLVAIVTLDDDLRRRVTAFTAQNLPIWIFGDARRSKPTKTKFGNTPLEWKRIAAQQTLNKTDNWSQWPRTCTATLHQTCPCLYSTLTTLKWKRKNTREVAGWYNRRNPGPQIDTGLWTGLGQDWLIGLVFGILAFAFAES
jgi:hypothetical protein